MRNPTALDAMARWLVLTLAAVGLFALVPGTSYAAPGFASTRWLFALHPVQVVAVVMIVAAWVLFVVHVALLRGPWLRDPVSLCLGALALVAAGVFVAAFSMGVQQSIVATSIVAVALHVAFCVRVDRIRRGRVHPVVRRRAAQGSGV